MNARARPHTARFRGHEVAPLRPGGPCPPDRGSCADKGAAASASGSSSFDCCRPVQCFRQTSTAQVRCHTTALMIEVLTQRMHTACLRLPLAPDALCTRAEAVRHMFKRALLGWCTILPSRKRLSVCALTIRTVALAHCGVYSSPSLLGEGMLA